MHSASHPGASSNTASEVVQGCIPTAGMCFGSSYLASSDCAYSSAKSTPSFCSDPSEVTCRHMPDSKILTYATMQVHMRCRIDWLLVILLGVRLCFTNPSKFHIFFLQVDSRGCSTACRRIATVPPNSTIQTIAHKWVEHNDALPVQDESLNGAKSPKT
jgi:hypothetical protein